MKTTEPREACDERQRVEEDESVFRGKLRSGLSRKLSRKLSREKEESEW
jgi:hypothetical protein